MHILCAFFMRIPFSSLYMRLVNKSNELIISPVYRYNITIGRYIMIFRSIHFTDTAHRCVIAYMILYLYYICIDLTCVIITHVSIHIII